MLLWIFFFKKKRHLQASEYKSFQMPTTTARDQSFPTFSNWVLMEWCYPFSLLFGFSLCRPCSSRVNFWPGSLQLFAAVFTLFFCKGTFRPNNKRWGRCCDAKWVPHRLLWTAGVIFIFGQANCCIAKVLLRTVALVYHGRKYLKEINNSTDMKKYQTVSFDYPLYSNKCHTLLHTKYL